MEYKKLIGEILINVGGHSNILNFENNVTRLKLKVMNDSLINKKNLEEINGIYRVILFKNEIQLIIGNNVNKVYKEMAEVLSQNSSENVPCEEIEYYWWGGVKSRKY